MKTFLRRLEILNYLRSKPSSTGTEQILRHLQDGGYLDEGDTKPRSQFRLVQRDLNFLLGKDDESGNADNDFGLTMERGEGKTLRWRLDPYQQLNYDFERMPAYMALALSVSQKHLKQVLPSNTQRELSQLFTGADIKLQQSENKLSPVHYRRLANSVEFFQRGQHLQAPEFDIGLLDTLYRAILAGKRVTISYQSGGEPKHYDLHPFGVAIMLPKLYLVAKKHEDIDQGDEAFRSFLIHKILNIEVNPLSNRIPEDFSLKHYLEEGNMDVLLDPDDREHYELVLELQVSEHSKLISDLRQSPISADQMLTQTSFDRWHLSATVRRTAQLQNWLLSLGDQARIIAPEIIRSELIEMLDSMRRQYD